MVKIHCQYFRHNGSFECEGEGEFDDMLFVGCVFPQDYARRLREMRLLPDRLTWSEYVVICIGDEFSGLLLPQRNVQ